MLGNLLRSWRRHSRRPARQPRRRWRPFHRDLESRLHAVRAGDQGAARRPAASLDRYRHGARAPGRGATGQARQLRHRHDAGAHPGLGRGDGHRSRRAALELAPRGRRSSARLGLPDRRRRAALERRPRLRAAPDHAPRHAPRPDHGRQGAADVSPGASPGAPDGRGLSRTSARPASDHRDAEAGRGAVPQHARARPQTARRGNRAADQGRHPRRRDRLPSLRHLWISARSYPGCAAGTGHRRRCGRLRDGHGPSARRGAQGLGRFGRGGHRSGVVPDPRKGRRHRVPRLRDGGGRRPRCGTARRRQTGRDR